MVAPGKEAYEVHKPFTSLRKIQQEQLICKKQKTLTNYGTIKKSDS